MTRPLRLEYAGALYHVTSRGDRRESIYWNDDDRQKWLDILDLVCERFNWLIHSYCLMDNHYHILVETPDGNLCKGMRQLNGLYSQSFNRRNRQVGHVFQGRYKAIIVQKESHLLELSRYVVLNPVRAGIVGLPEEWNWSSYNYFLQDGYKHPWLDRDWLLSQFSKSRRDARSAFTKFVLDGIGLSSPLLDAKNQMFLGDEQFAGQHQQEVESEKLRNCSLVHRRSIALTLAQYQAGFESRDEAMARAYRSGGYSMREIGDLFRVHSRTVSRAVQQYEQNDCK